MRFSVQPTSRIATAKRHAHSRSPAQLWQRAEFTPADSSCFILPDLASASATRQHLCRFWCRQTGSEQVPLVSHTVQRSILGDSMVKHGPVACDAPWQQRHQGPARPALQLRCRASQPPQPGTPKPPPCCSSLLCSSSSRSAEKALAVLDLALGAGSADIVQSLQGHPPWESNHCIPLLVPKPAIAASRFIRKLQQVPIPESVHDICFAPGELQQHDSSSQCPCQCCALTACPAQKLVGPGWWSWTLRPRGSEQ